MTEPYLAKLSAANTDLQNFNFASAAQAYKEVLEDQPGHTGAMLGLALVFNRTGHNKQALQILRTIWKMIEQSSPENQNAVSPATKAEILAQIGLALQILNIEDKALAFYK